MEEQANGDKNLLKKVLGENKHNPLPSYCTYHSVTPSYL
jgi:hypothetical protein